MVDVRAWITRCSRRLNRGVVLKFAAEWLAAWLCLFGTFVLLAKLVWPALWPHSLWGAATVIPVLVLARRRAMRQPFLAGDGAALLDDRLGTNGLLMTVVEQPDSRWRRQLPGDDVAWAAAMPRVRPVRFVKIVLLPALFLGIALSVPAKESTLDRGQRQRPRMKAVAQLPQMLEELKKADIVDPEEHKFLKEEIDKVVKQTAKAPPNAEQWRKIDELRNRLAQKLNARARTLKKGQQAAERLAKAAKSPDRNLTKRELKRLEKDLNDALARLGQQKGVKPATTEKTGAIKTASKSPAQKTALASKTATSKSPNRKVVGKTSKTKTNKVAGVSKTKSGSPGKTTSVAKKTGAKSPAGSGRKTVASKSGTRKTGGMPGVANKSGGGVSKTQRGAKSPTGKTGTRIAKTGKTAGAKQKVAAKRKTAKTAKSKQSQKMPKLDQLPDLEKLLEMASKLPPEMQQRIQRQIEQQLMRMAQSGQLRLPQDPELRRKLMQQAMKLLSQNADKLEELKKRFGHLARNLPRDGGGDPKTPVDRTGQPQAGKKKSGSSVAFRDVVLPPGFGKDEPTRIERVVGKSPKVAPVKPSFNAADNEPTGTSRWQSWKRNYPPRYRSLLRKYFEPERKR